MEIVDEANLTYKQPFVFFFFSFLSRQKDRTKPVGLFRDFQFCVEKEREEDDTSTNLIETTCRLINVRRRKPTELPENEFPPYSEETPTAPNRQNSQRESSFFFIDSSSMNCPYSSFRTVAYSLPSPVHIPKSLVSPNFTSISALNSGKVGPSVYWKIVLKPVGKRSLRVRASKSDDAGTEKWLKWLPNGALAADKILRLIASATASPISQFISSPVTFLHSVDPRIKLVN